MSKKKNHEVVVPVLNNEYKVIVLVSKDINYVLKKAHEWYLDENLEEEDLKEFFDLSTRRGVCVKAPNCHPMILVPSVRGCEKIGTLAHEALHAVREVSRHCGVEDEEFEAMTVGAIVRTVLEKVNV